VDLQETHSSNETRSEERGDGISPKKEPQPDFTANGAYGMSENFGERSCLRGLDSGIPGFRRSMPTREAIIRNTRSLATPHANRGPINRQA
jgi:hypothetical protein